MVDSLSIAPVLHVAFRADRDQAHIDRSLEKLKQAAGTSENLIPLMLDAVRGYATVGEVCSALIPVFGVYRETSVI